MNRFWSACAAESLFIALESIKIRLSATAYIGGISNRVVSRSNADAYVWHELGQLMIVYQHILFSIRRFRMIGQAVRIIQLIRTWHGS